MTRWSSKTIDELAELYWSEVAPDLRRQNIDPHDPPASVVAREARGLDYALREHHDHTVGQFLTDVVGLEANEADAEPQGTRARNVPADVRELIDDWIDGFRGLGQDYSENTLRTKRSRVYAYADAYQSVNDAPLLGDLQDSATKRDEEKRVEAAFERIGSEYESSEAILRLMNEVEEWYDNLKGGNLAEYNPSTRNRERSGWSREDRDNPALDPNQIATLYEAADTTADRLLVIALCAWGLRPSEVASLHISNIVLDPDDEEVPILDFGPGERKNNESRRSTVSMLYGVDVLRNRIHELAVEDADGDWNGYIWPSPSAASGHRTPDTIRAWFKDLAAEADVTVEGEVAVPKMGRRYWYDQYAEAIKVVLERLEAAADEQGSVSASVVHGDYLGEDSRRRQRREEMRKRLSEAFEQVIPGEKTVEGV
jgi:integrase